MMDILLLDNLNVGCCVVAKKAFNDVRKIDHNNMRKIMKKSNTKQLLIQQQEKNFKQFYLVR